MTSEEKFIGFDPSKSVQKAQTLYVKLKTFIIIISIVKIWIGIVILNI